MPSNCKSTSFLCDLSLNFSSLKVISGNGNSFVLSGVDNSLLNGTNNVNAAVALKRLPLVGKGHCRVALRELRVLKRLSHENIIKTMKIIDSSGNTIDPNTESFNGIDNVYVVEELLDSDLQRIIERNGKLSLETCKIFLYQLLRGLKYIHSANVVHRDIKPGNLFVKTDDLTLKVGDYGLARVFDYRYTHKGYLTALVSTRYYRAPEVILKTGDYSYPIDIWSAGCVFGEMLLGKVLFPGENDLDQIDCICRVFGLKVENIFDHVSMFPEHLFRGISSDAIDLLSKMICIDPDRRISAEQALCHPFFADLHDPLDEPICMQPFYVEHEIDNLPIKELKGKILEDSFISHCENKTFSSENLFKNFEETFIFDDFKNKVVSILDDSNISKEHTCSSLKTKDCIPNINDVVSRETLLDEPQLDPGICKIKFHEPNDCVVTKQNLNSLDSISQQSSYYSSFSPVIDVNVYKTCHFLAKHTGICINNKQTSSGESLNDKIITKLCEERKFGVEEMISKGKLSTLPCTTWQSVCFSI
ncbi:mitogen-activated protein kinase 1 isoform X1 [Hydra vulgaris]|nr:mitogen-activated protein kinase 1 [Hydra vulgaris]